MTEVWDAIVVGAGPAGCAAAYELAAAKKRVLLLDRQGVPREKACGGGLTIKSLRALRYPVDPVIRFVCREIVLGLRVDKRKTARVRSAVAAMVVRSEFDAFCLERTREAGAEFRMVGRLLAVEEQRDGISLRTSSGKLRGLFVIGADGADSSLRGLLWSPHWAATNGLAIEGQIPSVELGRLPMEFDFGAVASGYGWLFPKDDHVNVGVYTCDPNVRLSRRDLERYAEKRLGRSAAERTHRVIGHSVGLRYLVDWPVRDRATLVGDAAQAVDPLLGEGIFYAIWSGQEAAAAVLDELEGRAPFRTSMEARGLRVARDLRTCWKATSMFHANLDWGYRILASLPVRHALLSGFAAGWTFSQTKHRLFLAPLAAPGAPDYVRLKLTQFNSPQ
jgi:geranylgeranyl reductase family protein